VCNNVQGNKLSAHGGVVVQFSDDRQKPGDEKFTQIITILKWATKCPAVI